MERTLAAPHSRIVDYAALAVAAAALSCALFAREARAAAPVDGRVAQADVCRNCGVVESVTPVRRGGQAKGIAGTPVTPGMAIGGVVGGVLGNQVGGGSGRSAATVLGAAGGAYAGHAIEKNRAQYTAYVMRVRMQDGSVRTVEQRTALAKGSQVVVDGKTAHLASRAARHG